MLWGSDRGTASSREVLDTLSSWGLATPMEPLKFAGQIRYWNPERSTGLAVIDVPAAVTEALGGLKQQRVHGTIGPAPFSSNVMPAGSGRLALSVSKAMMGAAGVGVGDEADVVITRVGRD